MLFASIGSVSTGTLLPRDLADSYYFELSRLAGRDDDAERKARALSALSAVQPLLKRDADADLPAIEAFVNETAYELFSEYCAPFTHFGSHAGDGADIGIWPDIDSVEEAARYGDGVVKVNAGDEWPELDASVSYVLEVNDHGNASLYEVGTRHELWACV